MSLWRAHMADYGRLPKGEDQEKRYALEIAAKHDARAEARARVDKLHLALAPTFKQQHVKMDGRPEAERLEVLKTLIDEAVAVSELKAVEANATTARTRSATAATPASGLPAPRTEAEMGRRMSVRLAPPTLANFSKGSKGSKFMPPLRKMPTTIEVAMAEEFAARGDGGAAARGLEGESIGKLLVNEFETASKIATLQEAVVKRDESRAAANGFAAPRRISIAAPPAMPMMPSPTMPTQFRREGSSR